MILRTHAHLRQRLDEGLIYGLPGFYDEYSPRTTPRLLSKPLIFTCLRFMSGLAFGRYSRAIVKRRIHDEKWNNLQTFC